MFDLVGVVARVEFLEMRTGQLRVDHQSPMSYVWPFDWMFKRLNRHLAYDKNIYSDSQ